MATLNVSPKLIREDNCGLGIIHNPKDLDNGEPMARKICGDRPVRLDLQHRSERGTLEPG